MSSKRIGIAQREREREREVILSYGESLYENTDYRLYCLKVQTCGISELTPTAAFAHRNNFKVNFMCAYNVECV